jgi:hypothetical protein
MCKGMGISMLSLPTKQAYIFTYFIMFFQKVYNFSNNTNKRNKYCNFGNLDINSPPPPLPFNNRYLAMLAQKRCSYVITPIKLGV